MFIVTFDEFKNILISFLPVITMKIKKNDNGKTAFGAVGCQNCVCISSCVVRLNNYFYIRNTEIRFILFFSQRSIDIVIPP